ncbi:Flp family type IVb pilin [Cupriavidus alkaliphilus]|uniref:Pilus assembly protein Flp/PilA n=1 Tax=Cupriavidus alkaliphilus TaxID=942866 RepID=A0A7W4VE08_9BURK|nr:Flp family type IVb pilin [Cupriavidus alkaliphilus]MBB3009413.1 pilus assembly protein Flp/PilA [Cupriavidus alkaliphilus]
MKRLIARFIKDERGATAIEYGLIAGLIALAIAASAGSLGTNLKDGFQNLANKVGVWLPKP